MEDGGGVGDVRVSHGGSGYSSCARGFEGWGRVGVVWGLERARKDCVRDVGLQHYPGARFWKVRTVFARDFTTKKSKASFIWARRVVKDF